MFLDFTQEMVSWSAVTRVQRRSQVFESVCWMIDAHRCFIVLDLTSQRLDRDYVFIVARIKPRLKKQLRLPLFALPLQIPSCTNSSNDKHASDFIEDAIVYTLLISPELIGPRTAQNNTSDAFTTKLCLRHYKLPPLIVRVAGQPLEFATNHSIRP